MHLPQNFAAKSGFPYLVDVKLTEFCPFEGGSGICKNCYQSSTKNGAHAEQYFVSYSLPKILMDAGVLEVNFGGGEPTLYQGSGYGTFQYVLSAFKHKKFKVGVTTKNYNWHKSKGFRECIKNIDSVAISVNSLEELEKARGLEEAIAAEPNGTSIYYQCVFELVPYEDFKKFIEKIAEKYHANVTLLGYKDFGFGKGGKKHDYPDEWMAFIKEIHDKKGINVGIDSVMVANWREKLIEFGVKDYYLVGTEGKSTCYVDAVKKKMYSSSFSDEEGLPMPVNEYDKKADFLKNFATF